jgi:YtkA-like
MRHLVVVAAIATALIATGSASAGGWATIGLDPPFPPGGGPGEPWNTDMTILQHGQTPLTGLHPTITITLEETGRTETFAATETDEPGVYSASVVFPEAGSWTVLADSTFGESKLTYGPVQVEPGPAGGAGGSDDGFPVLPLLAVLGALAAGAAALFGVRRQRRLHPAG